MVTVLVPDKLKGDLAGFGPANRWPFCDANRFGGIEGVVTKIPFRETMSDKATDKIADKIIATLIISICFKRLKLEDLSKYFFVPFCNFPILIGEINHLKHPKTK